MRHKTQRNYRARPVSQIRFLNQQMRQQLELEARLWAWAVLTIYLSLKDIKRKQHSSGRYNELYCSHLYTLIISLQSFKSFIHSLFSPVLYLNGRKGWSTNRAGNTPWTHTLTPQRQFYNIHKEDFSTTLEYKNGKAAWSPVAERTNGSCISAVCTPDECLPWEAAGFARSQVRSKSTWHLASGFRLCTRSQTTRPVGISQLPLSITGRERRAWRGHDTQAVSGS